MAPPLLLVSIGGPPAPAQPLPPVAAAITSEDMSDASIIDAVKQHGVEAALVCFPQDAALYLPAIHACVRLIRCGFVPPLPQCIIVTMFS